MLLLYIHYCVLQRDPTTGEYQSLIDDWGRMHQHPRNNQWVNEEARSQHVSIWSLLIVNSLENVELYRIVKVHGTLLIILVFLLLGSIGSHEASTGG